MTIGRLPKIDPGATPPQNRKPAPPAGNAGFKTAPPGKDRVPHKPPQPSTSVSPKSSGAPPKPTVSEPKPAGKPAPPQAPLDAPQGGAQGSARIFWQQLERVATGSSKPAPQTTASGNSMASGWNQSAPPAAPHKQPPAQKPVVGEPIQRPDKDELRRFAESSSKWRIGQNTVKLSANRVTMVTADHVKLFPPGTQHVFFDGVRITQEAMQALSETHNLHIKSLTLEHIRDFVPGGGAFPLPESLEDLYLEGPMPGLRQLLTSAGRLPGLKMLTASNTGIDDADIGVLAVSASLEQIILRKGHVTAKGVHALLSLPALEVLYLPDQEIGANGSPQLSASKVPPYTKLSKLDLSGNPQLSNASIPALYRLALTEANINRTGITHLPADSNNRWKNMDWLCVGRGRLTRTKEDLLSTMQEDEQPGWWKSPRS